MRKKKVIRITAIILTVLILVGALSALIITLKSDKKTDGELLTKEILNNYTVKDIIGNPDWEKDLINSYENYLSVNSDRFDFAKQIGISGGKTNLYFNTDSLKIERIMHNFVSYTKDKDPKIEINNLIARIEERITFLLGNPAQPFHLMNTSGEFKDYENLSADEMTDKLIEGGTVLYTLYETDGLRYELNIMFSDDTIFLMVWIYDENKALDGIEETEGTQ